MRLQKRRPLKFSLLRLKTARDSTKGHIVHIDFANYLKVLAR